jgi:poly(A) polymerase/tRNA nucleotidyltransferase (CCA-adding enzyme)
MRLEKYLNELIGRLNIDISGDVLTMKTNETLVFENDAINLAELCSALAKPSDWTIIDFIKGNRYVFEKLPAQGIKNGLTNIVTGKRPSAGFEFLRLTCLLESYFPWLYVSYGVEQNEYHAHDVYYHLVYSCDSAENKLHLRLAALLHDAGKVKSKRKIQKGEDEKDVFYNHEVIGSKMSYRILKNLGFEKELYKKVSRLVRNHMFHYTDEWTNSAIRRFIKTAGDDMADLFLLRDADRSGNGKRIKTPSKIRQLKKRIDEVIRYDNRFTVKNLDISGKNLIEELEMSPGPEMGNILGELLIWVLEDMERNNYSDLIAKAKDIYNREQ